MATYTTPSGIIITDAAATTADFPSVLKGLMDGSRGGNGLNEMITPPFPNLAALQATYPEGAASDAGYPVIARIRNLGAYVYVMPQGIWTPMLFKKLLTAPAVANTTVAPDHEISATGQLTVGPFRWPHLIRVHYRVLVTGPGGNSFEAYVNVSETTTDSYRVNLGSGRCEFEMTNDGTGAGAAATTLKGGVSHSGGSDVLNVIGNAANTRLTAVVEPLYGGSGA